MFFKGKEGGGGLVDWFVEGMEVGRGLVYVF